MIKQGNRSYAAVVIILIFILTVFNLSNCKSAPEIIEPVEEIVPEALASVTLINNTGTTIWQVNIAEVSSDNWGGDWLAPDQIIRNSENIVIQLNFPLSVVNTYDFRFIDYGGNTYTKRNITISNNSRIFINASDFCDGPPVIIINNTGVTIWYVYISETTSSYWGKDALYADQMISNGQSAIVRLPYNIGEVNRYDFMLVEAYNRSEYVRMNVPVSSYCTVVFNKDDLYIAPNTE